MVKRICNPSRQSSSAVLVMLFICAFTSGLVADENDYYRMTSIPVPEGLALEVTGLATLPDGRLAVSIRKGEVWIIKGADAAKPTLEGLTYTKFAEGLHEPLGLTFHKGSLYTVQRSEVTQLIDADGDDQADEYRTVAKGWGVTGNYHEYAYGPVFDAKDNLYVTLNSTIGKKIINDTAWRGWSLRFTPQGKLEPVSAGMRSPIGIGLNHAGDLFGTDHQGNWFPTCPLYHIRDGVFHGHVDSLSDTSRLGSPLKHPGKIPTGLTVGQAAEQIPGYALPAVWFPYKKMGMGSTGILCDTTRGKFGPFADQLFVGDFTMALISRVALEKVDGQYQGACFPFRKGFDSAVIHMTFAADGAMFVGQTNRGWNSVGSRSYGLQRLDWTRKIPFEIKTMHATKDGFILTFTSPVHGESAIDPKSYAMTSYTYAYHSTYGSDEIQPRTLNIRSVQMLSATQVKLIIDGLRPTFVHELTAAGVRDVDGRALLHAAAYYTLNRIPN